MLALQQRKKLLADLSLGEGNAQKVGSKSIVSVICDSLIDVLSCRTQREGAR